MLFLASAFFVAHLPLWYVHSSFLDYENHILTSLRSTACSTCTRHCHLRTLVDPSLHLDLRFDEILLQHRDKPSLNSYRLWHSRS
jgi:hypothetical protein